MSCSWIGWCALAPEAQAAWLQAGGSLAAVLTAVAVPLTLYLKDRSAKREAARRAQAWFVISLRPLLRRFSLKVSTFLALHEGLEGEVLDPTSMDSNYSAEVPLLVAMLKDAPGMPHLDPQLSSLARSVLELETELETIVQYQAGGLHGAWINNRDHILDLVRAVLANVAAVEKAIDEIS